MYKYEKSMRLLEFDSIRDMLLELALTEGAKALVDTLTPTDDPVEFERRQRKVTDAKRLAGLKGMPGFGGVVDIRDSVERADKGATLSPRELLDIANLAKTTRRLTDYIRGDRTFETVLDEIFDRLLPVGRLEHSITRAIIAEDMIADEASPELASIRRRIRNVSNKIRDILQKYVSGGPDSKYLQENIITTRGGRYVIPVKSEYRNEIKGLVHDTSASGATLFVEPMSVLEANNELRELEAAEKHEIDRILAELSKQCAESADALRLNYLNITELAFIFACADLSFKQNASEPHLSKNGMISLRHARHPLLDPQKVVPIDVYLGGDYRMMVITGPNTGGKTVTLKTIGLLQFMAQCGLHIPASEPSEVVLFSQIYADIGDEQSIEQSLSTFSSHMTNIVSIVSNLGPDTLVLFDELGAGTDPVEGAALAMAILERVLESGAMCAATTHYAELKAFALETEGVRNASCEFDVDTLRPTYRLIIGTPGKSNAFAISEKLGLSQSIIKRANELVNSDNKSFELVIDKLERTRMEMERERDRAAQLRVEFERFKENAEEELRKKVGDAEKAAERAREQARQTIAGAKATSEYVLAQLEEIKKQKESADFGRRLQDARRDIRAKLREGDDIYNAATDLPDDGYTPPRPYEKGDKVLVRSINKTGTLLDDPDKNGNVTVQIGPVKTRMRAADLRLLDSDTVVTGKQKASVSKFRATVSREFRPELDVRGQNGEDAWFAVDKYIDEALVAGIKSVTIIHGKGTGALRAALWDNFKADPRISSFRAGAYGQGDYGVTVLELK